MHLNEYSAHDGVGLAQLVARGDVSAAELAALAALAIETVNPRLNAVIEHWQPDVAQPPASGPLAGVPFLIKDLAVSYAGRRSELGSRLAAGLVAPADSYLMGRFKAAGLQLSLIHI